MTMRAATTLRAADSSINRRRATPVPALAIDRPSSLPLRPLPTAVGNAPPQRTPRDVIPIKSDALPRHTSRGFLPWRFVYAGPAVRAAPPSWGRHPQTFTNSEVGTGNREVRFAPNTGHCRLHQSCPKGPIGVVDNLVCARCAPIIDKNVTAERGPHSSCNCFSIFPSACILQKRMGSAQRPFRTCLRFFRTPTERSYTSEY